MPEKQLVHRILSSLSNVEGSKWRNPYRMFSASDYDKANFAMEQYGKWDIYIHDEPKQTVTDIRAAVRKHKENIRNKIMLSLSIICN